jgi:hypothetical protein
MSEILPGCTSVEAFLDNSHEENLVTMTTSVNEECKPIFKWDSPYSWTYKGNLAGKSMIKQAVKSHGGRVDGVLRFSIMWSEGKSNDDSDLDAHCIEPDGNRIYFGDQRSYTTGGNLDVDIQTPSSYKRQGKPVVENITFPNLGKMKDGKYAFLVRQYHGRDSGGFTAEIEYNGEIHEYTYPKRVVGDISVAVVTLKGGEFSIEHSIDSSTSSRKVYNLDTKKFHKVDLVCLSPNHWGKNNTGNKHYFFMLENCVAEGSIRSFHSENLEPELAKHRKVLEVLGATNMVTLPKEQLSGLGFNATVKDEVILRLKGSFKRVVKVKF